MLNGSEALRPDDQYFKRGVRVSVAAHVVLALFFLINLMRPQNNTLDLSQAIRVDMVGLPDKIDHRQLPAKIHEKPAEAAPKAEVKEEEVVPKKILEKLPDKVKPKPKTDTSAVGLRRTKTKQKEALEKLKKLSAIEKIKQDMKTEDQQAKIHEAAAKAIAKGRVISAGTTITGLDKIEVNAYLQSLDQQIKQHWALPQWLIDKPLKAQVQVKFNSSGDIISRAVLVSSGQSAYDNYCLQAVDQAAPFPQVPEKFSEIFSVDGVVIGFPE